MSSDTSNATKFTWQQHKTHIGLIPRTTTKVLLMRQKHSDVDDGMDRCEEGRDHSMGSHKKTTLKAHKTVAYWCRWWDGCMWRRQDPMDPFQSALTREADSVFVGLLIPFTNQLDGSVNIRPGVPEMIALLPRLMVWGWTHQKWCCSLAVTWAIPPFFHSRWH